jgi:hypothetical protein
MVTQNAFMKFLQCDHITCNIIFKFFLTYYSFIFFLWPVTDNSTSCDKIMYSTLTQL